jgi:hypothetical protein
MEGFNMKLMMLLLMLLPLTLNGCSNSKGSDGAKLNMPKETKTKGELYYDYSAQPAAIKTPTKSASLPSTVEQNTSLTDRVSQAPGESETFSSEEWTIFNLQDQNRNITNEIDEKTVDKFDS